MQKKVWVEATYEIVGAIKGHKLADRQTVIVPVDISGLLEPYSLEAYRTVFFALVDTALKNGAAQAFIQRLKSETALKRKVGGTKWVVSPVGGVEAQPLYIKESKLGDFYQFLRGRKVARWDEEKKEQYFTVIYPNLVGQITDRNYAIVKQLYEQAIRPQAANDGDEKQAA